MLLKNPSAFKLFISEISTGIVVHYCDFTRREEYSPSKFHPRWERVFFNGIKLHGVVPNTGKKTARTFSTLRRISFDNKIIRFHFRFKKLKNLKQPHDLVDSNETLPFSIRIHARVGGVMICSSKNSERACLLSYSAK